MYVYEWFTLHSVLKCSSPVLPWSLLSWCVFLESALHVAGCHEGFYYGRVSSVIYTYILHPFLHHCLFFFHPSIHYLPLICNRVAGAAASAERPRPFGSALSSPQQTGTEPTPQQTLHQSVNLPLSSPITHEQDPEILELSHLRQNLTPS